MVSLDMLIIKLKKVDCKRCGYSWVPRKPIVVKCPKCNSPYWNVERKNKVREIVLNKDVLSEIKDLVKKVN